MSNMLWWFDTKRQGRPAARTPARSTARRVPHRRRLAVSDFWSRLTTTSWGRRPSARAGRWSRSKTRSTRPKAARNGAVNTQSRTRRKGPGDADGQGRVAIGGFTSPRAAGGGGEAAGGGILPRTPLNCLLDPGHGPPHVGARHHPDEGA